MWPNELTERDKQRFCFFFLFLFIILRRDPSVAEELNTFTSIVLMSRLKNEDLQTILTTL